jgi:hypothetical protein
MNTFVLPYFACTIAVNASASTQNVLINPTYAGLVDCLHESCDLLCGSTAR